MTEWLRKIFESKQSGTTARLIVHVGETKIGTLRYDDGLYIFEYDANCPDHLKIKGMEKNVRSPNLPPFFSTRLPSNNRPEVISAINKLENDDPITILGNVSASSPVSPYMFKISKVA